MADLSITAASVVARGGSKAKNGAAGAAVTAGQLVYLEKSSGTYKLADSNSGTAEARSPDGIALNAAAVGQPLRVLVEGPITIGATLTAGVAYYASATPGGICPAKPCWRKSSRWDCSKWNWATTCALSWSPASKP